MPSCRLIQRWAAAAAVLLLIPAGSHAAGGFKYALPIGVKNPSGLTLAIDGRGIDANGYRSVMIEVIPRGNKPLPADRQLRVVLEFSKYAAENTAKISQIIELPEGSTSVKATVLVPQSAAWTNLAIETYEGGEKLKDLSHENFRWASTTGWSWTEARPALLFIDSHVPPRADRDSAVDAFQKNAADASPTYMLPDVRPLLTLFPDITNTGGPPAPSPGTSLSSATKISDTALLSIIASRTRTEMLAPAELPSRWVELSQYDIAVISLSDLQQMAKTHSSQLVALRNWLSTGPVLIVYGIGSDFARLAALEEMLELGPLPVDAKDDTELRGWTHPNDKDRTAGLHTPFDEDSMAAAVPVPRRPRTFAQMPAAKSKPPTDMADVVSSAPSGIHSFIFRRAATGCVVAIASDKPFPGSPKDWTWISNSTENHWKWFRRSGLSLHRTNHDYWKFLIPGVGEAPVVSFLLLVSLFAVAIGPVNYLLLGRQRRLYLLLLTVPVGAALVTVSLFAFALFSDGFSMRLRMRSFADLDQQTGRAAVWSRQSYYAAMAPSQGLVFPEDATVFPIAHEPSARGNDRATLLAWDGDQQLRRGFLSSRTATQFMVCRATTSKARLLVTEGTQGSQPPKVENRLATRIQYVLLRDSRGDYFAGQAIADQQSKELGKIDLTAAATAMSKLALAVKPTEPHGYDPNLHDDNLFLRIGARYSRMTSSDSGAGDPSMEKSLLETNIAAALEPTTHPLVPGTYIAIVESSPLVVSGVPRAREEASLHVIRGRY
jgi:hypothetical protein